MKKAFVDTTILVDSLLKLGESQISAKQSLKCFDITELPVYAIKEFKSGALQYFVWLHNKLVQTDSFAHTFEALYKLSATPQRHRLSTALEALKNQLLKTKSDLKNLTANYGRDAEIDKVQADRIRLSLLRQINNAWLSRRKLTTNVVQDLECYSELKPFKVNQQIFLQPNKCSKGNCCLDQKYKSQTESLIKILEKLKTLEEKKENTNRITILKKLIKKKNFVLQDQECRQLGDIYFSIFCPNDSIILTTNLKDHLPIAEAIRKQVTSPAELIV